MAEEIPVRATGPLQTMSQKGVPPVTWEHKENRFRIFLKGVAIKPSKIGLQSVKKWSGQQKRRDLNAKLSHLRCRRIRGTLISFFQRQR